MEIETRLADLPGMHPLLLWDQIIPAAVAVFRSLGHGSSVLLPLELENLPNVSDNFLELRLHLDGVWPAQVERVRRTMEKSRLIEVAAIAISGLALYHAGKHSLHDVAPTMTRADYQVDEGVHLLEVAGRTRRKHWEEAWRQRLERLSGQEQPSFFLCVVEFETPSGKLAFFA